jgi:metallo-beta-lactamase class B
MKNFLLLLFLISIAFLNAEAGNGSKTSTKVTKLTEGFYVHTSYKLLGGKPFPSNGLIVDTKDGVVLIDTGWGEKPTKEILVWVETNLHKKVKLCIVSHSHDDRLGGISVLKKRNIRVISSKLTASKIPNTTFLKPEGILLADTTFTIGNVQIQTFYPGPGHTEDNITVWFPGQKVLFGGCFVKSTEAKDLGNIADANLKEWPNSLQKVIAKFPEVAFLIPGHQSWESTASLQHTLDLLDQKKK